MKQIIVNVPEDKVTFFYELLQQLGIEEAQDEISEEHKFIVMERMKSYEKNTSKLLTLQDIEEKLKFNNEAS